MESGRIFPNRHIHVKIPTKRLELEPFVFCPFGPFPFIPRSLHIQLTDSFSAFTRLPYFYQINLKFHLVLHLILLHLHTINVLLGVCLALGKNISNRQAGYTFKHPYQKWWSSKSKINIFWHHSNLINSCLIECKRSED